MELPVSEYEAKRQRRIEANQHKLKVLNISKPQQQPRITRKKREIEPLQPTRRSIRQRQLKENFQEEIETEELLEIQPLPRPKRVKTEPSDLLDVPITELSVSYKGKKQHLSSSKIEIQFQEFHERYLGTQLLPVGKNTVMQGLCPAGYMAKFSKMSGVQPWKNAVALFVNVESDSPYDNVFHQETEEGETTVHFQWFGQNRWHDESPLVVRLRGMERGLESLRFHESYYDKKEGEEPLLLFIRHTQGPYIYCGRLGYLGYKPESKPLEFRWQLLDVDSLQWEKIRGLLDFIIDFTVYPERPDIQMADSPLLTSVLLVLPTKLQGAPHIAQFINQFLLPHTIDGAVYLNLQRIIQVYQHSRPYTVKSMDGAAGLGKLELVQWLHTHRTEGCSHAAFTNAAANRHLHVLEWLYEVYPEVANPVQEIVEAAECGNVEIVEFLRHKVQDYQTEQAFIVAAARGHCDVVQLLINGISKQQVIESLMTAASDGCQVMVRLLLEKGEPNKLEVAQALKGAADANQCEVLKLLLEAYEADAVSKFYPRDPVKYFFRVESTVDKAFVSAVERGRIDVVKLLLGVYSRHICGALRESVRSHQLEVSEFLIDYCEAHHLKGRCCKKGAEYLYLEAVDNRDIKMAKLLAAKWEADTYLAVATAVRDDDIEMLRVLIPVSKSDAINYLFMTAAIEKHEKVLEFFLEEFCANTIEQALIQALLRTKRELERSQRTGELISTSTLKRIEWEQSASFKLVLSKCDAGRIFDQAASQGLDKLVLLLLGKMSRQRIRCAMVAAAMNGETEVVKMLKEKSDSTGIKCAFEMAVVRGHVDIVELLHRQCDSDSIEFAMTAGNTFGES